MSGVTGPAPTQVNRDCAPRPAIDGFSRGWALRNGIALLYFNGNIVLQWPKARNGRRYTRTPSSTDTSSNYSASMALLKPV